MISDFRIGGVDGDGDALEFGVRDPLGYITINNARNNTAEVILKRCCFLGYIIFSVAYT